MLKYPRSSEEILVFSFVLSFVLEEVRGRKGCDYPNILVYHEEIFVFPFVLMIVLSP